ncbi:MAG: pirin family protein [Chloroflexi bacterium]|nr:pirin family protein [Chloroflexota bacterium]
MNQANHSPRAIVRLIEPQRVTEGAGVLLRRSIATRTLDYLDPFLLFDHFGSDDPAEYLAGFPLHPHRGIETVTYMLAGIVRHRDTLGNAGSISAGEVQWMTAGRGIMHEEMPQPHDGKMEGFQLWVNLPTKLKMTAPRYQQILANEIPALTRADGSVIRVIAGKAENVTGAVTEIYADPTYLDVSLPAQTTFTHPIPRGHTAFAYVFAGQGKFDDTARTVLAPHLIVWGEGDYVTATAAAAPLRFLLISGKPLREPIARYGPFVMNTRAEIEQALRDLQNGTFVQR